MSYRLVCVRPLCPQLEEKEAVARQLDRMKEEEVSSDYPHSGLAERMHVCVSEKDRHGAQSPFCLRSLLY